jgi:hypothetical protein
VSTGKTRQIGRSVADSLGSLISVVSLRLLPCFRVALEATVKSMTSSSPMRPVQRRVFATARSRSLFPVAHEERAKPETNIMKENVRSWN